MKSNPSKKSAAKGKAVRSKIEAEDGAPVVKEKASVQRKQAKQIRFLSKIKDGQQRALSASKTLQKKKRTRSRVKAVRVISSISALADSLPSKEEMVKSSKPTHKRMPKGKARQQVVVKETQQLAAVLAHPQFQSNPFSAILKHLTNTLPPPEPPQKKEQEKKGQKKSGKKGTAVDHMEE